MEKNKLPETKLGKKLKISIIIPYFNEELGLELFLNAKKELLKSGVKEKNIRLTRVPGALEIPFTCQKISKKEKPSVIITLGAIIRGKTSHYDLVCNETYHGIMDVQLKMNIPIIFGVLTCENEKQAKERSSEKGLNKGKSFARSAILIANI